MLPSYEMVWRLTMKVAGAIIGIFLGAFIAKGIVSSVGWFPGLSLITLIGGGILGYKLGGKISDARGKG
jgi:hypothetical protein